MAFINWTEKYSINVQSIDNQHKKLVDMINKFYDEIDKKTNNELIGELVTNMKQYTQMHFSTEERLINTHGYPTLDNHKSEHQDFIKKVSELEDKIKNDKMVLSFEITNFLKKWITEHILCTDMQYSEFLVSKGVK